jgi:hypothetical protein
MADVPVLVLGEGEFHHKETFGRGTVNRGALHVPRVFPRARALEARVRAVARRFVGKG